MAAGGIVGLRLRNYFQAGTFIELGIIIYATNVIAMCDTKSNFTILSGCFIWVFLHSIVPCVGNAPFPKVTVLYDICFLHEGKVSHQDTKISLL